MNNFLRTAPTRRLLAVIAGLVVAIVAGTAIAVAASGSGPVPPKTSLARALHKALAAPAVNAVSGRVSFTNHLIDATDLQGGNSDPLLSGASGRFWLSGNRLRVELQSSNGDAQLVVNNGSFSIYDPASQTAYEGTVPSDLTGTSTTKHDNQQEKLPTVARIQRGLNQLAQHLDLSGAIPGDVAGRPVYTVRVAPKHDGGLLGAAEVAWDSVHGVPLRVAVYAQHDSTPILQLKITDISYGSVASSDFSISPPSGAKVVKIATPQHTGAAGTSDKTAKDRKAHRDVAGVAAVARHVPFTLAAPRSLDGLTRRSVALLDWAGSPAALITYGQNLGGVAVIEQVAKPGSHSSSSSSSSSGGGDNSSGLSLPTVSINGSSAQELATPLGTLLEFTRGGVSYTVVGSVPPTAAELAARAL